MISVFPPAAKGMIKLNEGNNLAQCCEGLGRLLEEVTDFPVMLKPVYGLGGKCIKKITGFDKDRRMLQLMNDERSVDDIVMQMKESEFKEYYIEEFIQQHEMLNEIFPKAVNSVRIQTFIDGPGVHVAGATLKLGTGENCVDNIGLNEFLSLVDLKTGVLLRTIKLEGHSILDIARGKYIVEQDKHPDTDVQITGRKLPFWKDVKELAVYCSRRFGVFRSIGLDIAITENGPIVLEGNVDWTAKYQQLVVGGIYKGQVKAIIDDGLR